MLHLTSLISGPTPILSLYHLPYLSTYHILYCWTWQTHLSNWIFFLQLIQNKITDGLPYKFYKSFLLPTSRILIPIFHMIASGSPPPSSWLNGYTILLHKKNTDPHYVSNLRPISLTNTDLKILSTILTNRFQSYAYIIWIVATIICNTNSFYIQIER